LYGKSFIMDDDFFEWLATTMEKKQFKLVVIDGLSFCLPAMVRLGGDPEGEQIPFDINHRLATIALMDRLNKSGRRGQVPLRPCSPQ
jgi:hypothetical protein